MLGEGDFDPEKSVAESAAVKAESRSTADAGPNPRVEQGIQTGEALDTQVKATTTGTFQMGDIPVQIVTDPAQLGDDSIFNQSRGIIGWAVPTIAAVIVGAFGAVAAVALTGLTIVGAGAFIVVGGLTWFFVDQI